MRMELSSARSSLLIASITPYFLQKGNVWFQENLEKVLEAAKTQQFFQDNILFLENGLRYSVSELLRKLDEFGYEKVLDVGDMGEFSHRGGTVEVFPVNGANAVRIEFLGNRVDAIEQLSAISVSDETRAKNLLLKRLRSHAFFSDIKNIKEGDYLVHLDHGVARFGGIPEMR